MAYFRIVIKIIEWIRAHRAPIVAMSAVIVMVVSYALVLPALTLTLDKAEDQGGIIIPSSVKEELDDAAGSSDEYKEPDDAATLSPEDGQDEDEELAASKQPEDASNNTETSQELGAEGQTDEGSFEITVTCGEDAEIPGGAELKAEEIASDTKEFRQYLAHAAAELGIDPNEISFARFFDIEIISDGQKIEPSADVDVQMKLSDASVEPMQVVHFSEDGPAVLESEQTQAKDNDGAVLEFTTDSFSTYGIISAPGPSSINDLDGYSMKISRGRYLLPSMSGSVDPSKIAKTTDESQAAVWTFEATGTAGVYNIYTMVGGTKQYINFSRYDDGNANVSLSNSPQGLNVAAVNGKYLVSWSNGTTTYYLNEYGNEGGQGFAGWHEANDGSQLTFSFTQDMIMPGERCMVLVKIDGTYYIVENNGALEEVGNPVDGNANKISVNTPMMWTYDGSHFYHPAEATGFNGSNLASGFFYRYIDPRKDNALSQDDATNCVVIPSGNGDYIDNNSNSRDLMTNAAINYNEADHTVTSVLDPTKTLKVVKEYGQYRIVGGDEPGEIAEVYLAKLSKSDLIIGEQYNTVNHIDISIEAVARVNIPLAYGTYYYYENGELKTLLVNRDNEITLNLSKDDIDITAEDIKNGEILAYKKGTNGERILMTDAYVIAGFSRNRENGESTDQVRIGGIFKVTDLPANNHSVNRDADYRAKRLKNRIYYSVSTTKYVEFDMQYEGHQLYSSAADALNEDNKLTSKSLVTLSSSFDYWDSRNECPGLFVFGDEEYWRAGDIIGAAIGRDDDTGSGMDFALGGLAENENSTRAIEITKHLVDTQGNHITPDRELKNVFHIYRKKIDGTADPNPIDEVKGLDVDAYDETQTQPDYSTYKLIHNKDIRVGDGGKGIVYDYDIEPGMIFIQEDKSEENLEEQITDINGRLWYYRGTRLETEYVWRNDGIEERRHVSKTYTTEDDAYNSIPDVLGEYRDIDGIDRYNGFLEFYVYNIYEEEYTDIPVKKVWKYGNGSPAEAPENAKVTFTLGRYKLVEDGENAITGSIRINQTVNGLGSNEEFHATYHIIKHINGHDSITVRSVGYDKDTNGALIRGLQPGEYTVKIVSAVEGKEVVNTPETRIITIPEKAEGEQYYQTVDANISSEVRDRGTAIPTVKIRVRKTHDFNKYTNNRNDPSIVYDQDREYVFPAGEQIAVNISRPGSYHNPSIDVQVYLNGYKLNQYTTPSYQQPTTPQGGNGYAGVRQNLIFTPSNGDVIDIVHKWEKESVWINSVSLYTGSGNQSSTNNANGRNLLHMAGDALKGLMGLLSADPDDADDGGIKKSTGLRLADDNSDSDSDPAVIPDSPIPGMHYVVDSDWENSSDDKQITLSGNTWEKVFENLEATDERGNKYLYYIKAVDEKNMPEGTTYAIGKDGDKILTSTGETVLSVTNTLPNEPPKIKIKKVDENGMPLTGARFSIKKDDDAASEFVISSNDGIYTTDPLESGNYTIKEVESPLGYTGLINTEEVTFVVESDYAISNVNTPSGVEYDQNTLMFTVVNHPDTESSKITVRKKWLDFFGNQTTHIGTMSLKLRQWVVNEHSVKVTFWCFGNGNGGAGGPTRIAYREATGVGDLIIQWDWNQYTKEQPFSIIGLKGATFESVWTPDGDQFQNDGSLRGGRQTVTVKGIKHDLPDINIYITNNNYDGTNGGLIKNLRFNGNISPEMTGGYKTITLGQDGIWSRELSLSGDGLLIDDGMLSGTVPATYNSKQCYYTIEEDETQPLTNGYELSQISSNPLEEGVLTAYNKEMFTDLTIVKEDQDDPSIKLAGAEFRLRQIDPNAEGTMDTRTLYDNNDPPQPIRIQNGITSDEPVESKGKLSFSQLGIGYYEISEIKAPDGYVLTDDTTFYLRITNTGIELLKMNVNTAAKNWSVTSSTSTISLSNSTITVYNEHGNELPHTGGIGTRVFYILGCIMTAGALILLIARRKVKTE